MICEYCKSETDNPSGICDECNKKFNSSEMEDIFSSSTKVAETVIEKPRIPFPILPKTDGELPLYAPPRIAAKVKSSKPILASLSVIAVAVIAILLFATGIFKTSATAIEKALEKGKYDTAYELYTQKYGGKNSKTLNLVLDERLKAVYDEYAGGNRSYATVESELETISKMADSDFKKVYEKHRSAIDKMKKSKDSYEKGVESHTKENYAFAIDCFYKVLPDDCKYPDAKNRLDLCVMSYKNQALSVASEAVRDGDYKTGIETLENALEVIKKDALVSKRIAEYKKSSAKKTRKDIVNTVDMLVLKEDYLGAIRCIENAMQDNEELKGDETLSKNLDYYKEKFAEAFGDDIDEVVKRKDYEKAGLLLNQAEDIIPENEIYLTKKAELDGKVPVYLDKLEPSDKLKWKQNKGAAIDSFGIDRSLEENYFILKPTSTASYYIGGDYKTFTASFAASKNIDDAVKCKVKITAADGGDYLYKECEISASTASQDISFNIKDCTSLTFSVSGEGANIIMYNAKLNR